MDNTQFVLCQGVSLADTGDVVSAFTVKGENIEGVLSAPLVIPAAKAFIKAVKEPVFFFIELPHENSESYDTYYLDNCTKKVAGAIIDCYGEVLANDGVSRFGFGSNATEEEIYFRDYQEFSAYVKSPQTLTKSLEQLGAQKKEKFKTLWDMMNDENPGCLTVVELDGETVFDIPDALKEAGMYKFKEESI